MKAFSRMSKKPPSTATDFVSPEKGSPPGDPEKKGSELELATSFRERRHHVVPEIERRVVRKMDFRIVPLVTALYVLAFLDRFVVGVVVLDQKII